jgi:hypothetical protein
VIVVNGSEHTGRGNASAHAALYGLHRLLSLARRTHRKADQQCATD